MTDASPNGYRSHSRPLSQPICRRAGFKYQLVINLNTVKALGLSLPIALLARSDEVIE